MNIEVNVSPLIKYLRQKSKINVYVPYMIDKSFKPVKYRLPLKKGRFNIKEPKNSHLKVNIDMAIVPIVGIDRLKKRIGFGKGIYDRYYASLKQKPYTIFTQRVLCSSNDILSQKHDISADCILTT